MANPKFFKQIFDEYAVDNCIGDPLGIIAYCYLRVSSSGQAEEGRTGLPRQIENIHHAAKERGYKVPWDLVFADDDSGFEFEGRPQLSILRKEYRGPNRRANAIVIEYLDRLSRNADWHQGFLLDEMRKYGVQTIFWKDFHSRIERSIMGAISQDGIEQTLQRMKQGNRIKAKSGRITARYPAFGYKLVDSNGEEGTKARKDTHYAIVPEKAEVIRFIYETLAYECVSLRALCEKLEERHYETPRGSSHWRLESLRRIVENTVYKGEYVSGKTRLEKVWVVDRTRLDSPGKFIKRPIAIPPDEWIIVPVPPIVSPELWERANKILEKNSLMAKRNGGKPFLLTGLLKCSHCSLCYTGRNFGGYRKNIYRCSSHSGARRNEIERGCHQPMIACHILDSAVWRVISDVLLHPGVLIEVLDRQFKGEGNEQLNTQIKYLQEQIEAKEVEDKKLYKAYLADVFDEEEYRGRRRQLKNERQNMSEEIFRLQAQVMTPEQYAGHKKIILDICERAQANGLTANAPFEIKRRIIKTLVDKIIVNTQENWFKIEGVITGQFVINELGRGAIIKDFYDEFGENLLQTIGTEGKGVEQSHIVTTSGPRCGHNIHSISVRHLHFLTNFKVVGSTISTT
jgi:site-specific DNA recombinase